MVKGMSQADIELIEISQSRSVDATAADRLSLRGASTLCMRTCIMLVFHFMLPLLFCLTWSVNEIESVMENIEDNQGMPVNCILK